MDKYIYTGKGAYMIGLPTRDMDADEWESYPKELTQAALEQGLYEIELEQSEVEDA